MKLDVPAGEALGPRRRFEEEAAEGRWAAGCTGRQRDILPLRARSPPSLPHSENFGRKVKRRHLASHHSLSWEREAITALNQLSGCCAEDVGTATGDDSVLQDWARRHVADCVQSWGKPTAGLNSRGRTFKSSRPPTVTEATP